MMTYEPTATTWAWGQVVRRAWAGLGRLVRPPVARQVARESTCDVLVLEQEPSHAAASRDEPDRLGARRTSEPDLREG